MLPRLEASALPSENSFVCVTSCAMRDIRARNSSQRDACLAKYFGDSRIKKINTIAYTIGIVPPIKKKTRQPDVGNI